MKFFIYGLVDPNNEQLRYIGRTSSGFNRPKWHGSDKNLQKYPHFHVSRWINQLKAIGSNYKIVVIQSFEDAELLSAAEIHWIAYFKNMGCPLTNMTSGGEGVVNPSAESTERRRKSMLGKNLGKKMSVATIEKMRLAHLGRPSPNLGKKASVATREKMSAARLGRRFSPEHREALRQARLRRI